jgi:hypothetical protein
MKAMLSWLAALLVTTVPLSAASAQTPYPVTPAAYGYPSFDATPYAVGYAGHQDGGCATCGGGKASVLSKLGLKPGGCNSCGKGGCNGKCGGGLCSAFKGWLCTPKPSDAPVLWHAQYPLGFPQHPYVRSPRDYFMWNDP